MKLIAALFSILPLTVQAADRKPNFIFIIADDTAIVYTSDNGSFLGDTPTCRSIRTEDAKLIVYKDKPEWTEVYDLKNDPYELNRLPADGPLARQLADELEKQIKPVDFKQ